jgi:hypothetical protein
MANPSPLRRPGRGLFKPCSDASPYSSRNGYTHPSTKPNADGNRHRLRYLDANSFLDAHCDGDRFPQRNAHAMRG